MVCEIWKGGESLVTPENQNEPWLPKIFETGKSRNIVITTGVTLQIALQASQENPKLEITVVHVPHLNELNVDLWKHLAMNSESIIVVEEHIPRGGLFTQLLHEFQTKKIEVGKLDQISLTNKFSHNYGSQEDHWKHNKITVDGIKRIIEDKIEWRRG